MAPEGPCRRASPRGWEAPTAAARSRRAYLIFAGSDLNELFADQGGGLAPFFEKGMRPPFESLKDGERRREPVLSPPLAGLRLDPMRLTACGEKNLCPRSSICLTIAEDLSLAAGKTMESESTNYVALLHRLIETKPGIGEKLKSIFSSYGHIEAYEHLLGPLETEVQSRVRFILSALNEIDEPSLLDRELEKILTVIDDILSGPDRDDEQDLVRSRPSRAAANSGDVADDAEGGEEGRAKPARKARKTKAAAKGKRKKAKTKKTATRGKSAKKKAKASVKKKAAKPAAAKKTKTKAKAKPAKAKSKAKAKPAKAKSKAKSKTVKKAAGSRKKKKKSS